MGSAADRKFRRGALSAAVLCAIGNAHAADDEVARLARPESSVSIGLGNWSRDRTQQGAYDGMRSDGAYGLIDADVVTRNDDTGTWFNFSTRSLGLQSREARAEWLRQGDIGATIEFSRIPRDMPYTVNTGLVGFGTSTQTRTNITPGAGSNVELGTVRDNWKFGFYKNLARGLDFKFRFTNEDKSGNRHMSRGGAPEFAVEPIDSTTQQAEATLDYAGEKLQLSGGYYGSWYENRNPLLSALGPTAATTFFISMPLNNQAHQGFLNGGYQFTPTTRATFKIAYTRATVDERIPTVDIASVARLAGSPTNLDGRVDTTLVQFGLTGRPTKDLSLSANLRYHDMRDKTPQARFVQTGAGTCATTATCTDNTPMSFRTLTGKVEGTYRLPENFSLIGGLERRDQDRTVPVGIGSINVAGVDQQRYVPFRSQVDETTYRLQLRRSMSETINASLAYLHSKRDGSGYTLTNEAESDQINPIHIADRKRNKWRGTIDWTPVESLSLQFNVEDARDEYGYTVARPYGLRDGSAVLYSVDATYTINEAWQVTAWFSHDRTKAKQIGQRAANGGASAAEKEAHLEDLGKSLGFGVRGKPSERIRLGADVQWIRSDSKYPESIAFTGAATVAFPSNNGDTVVSPLPDIQNQLVRLKLFGTYAVQKNADVRVDLIHERWRTDDWTWTFANGSPFVYGADVPAPALDGTRVNTVPRQISNFVGVRYIYRFQ